MRGSVQGGWSALLESIGATPAMWEPPKHGSVELPEWVVTLATSGREVDLDDLDRDEGTGLYLFQGQQVLVYIAFPYKNAEDLQFSIDNRPRFHFMDCKTIGKMKSEEKFELRYVAIARQDGEFPLTSREPGASGEKLVLPLSVCRNCLSALNYSGYSGATKAAKDSIVGEFDIARFFEEYSSQLSSLPVDICVATNPHVYHDDWGEISRRRRDQDKWTCTGCKVRFDRHRRLLHVHHRDGNKSYNARSNLVSLCALCHKAQPGHDHMYVDAKDVMLIRSLREAQGLA